MEARDSDGAVEQSEGEEEGEGEGEDEEGGVSEGEGEGGGSESKGTEGSEGDVTKLETEVEEDEEWWRRGFLNALAQEERVWKEEEIPGAEVVGEEELDEAMISLDQAMQLLLGAVELVADSSTTSATIHTAFGDLAGQPVEDDEDGEQQQDSDEEHDHDDSYGEWQGINDSALNYYAAAAVAATAAAPTTSNATAAGWAEELEDEVVEEEDNEHEEDNHYDNMPELVAMGAEDLDDFMAPFDDGPELMILVGGIWVTWPPEEFSSRILERG
jgi:hypothetical protein